MTWCNPIKFTSQFSLVLLILLANKWVVLFFLLYFFCNWTKIYKACISNYFVCIYFYDLRQTTKISCAKISCTKVRLEPY